jgi:hypothetical protein
MKIEFYKDDKVVYSINGRHGSYTINHHGITHPTDKKTGEVLSKWGIQKSVYYGKIAQCLDYILDCKISDHDSQNIATMMLEVKKFREEIKQIKEFKK